MKCQIEMRPFLRHRGLGVFCECLGYWFQEHVAIPRDAWQLVQQKHALMSWSPLSHAIQGWKQKDITVSEMANSSETNSANTFTVHKKAYCTCASAATTLSRNKLQVQMTKIPEESADQKDIVWYYHGFCMPKTLLWSKAILFGWSTWLSKCVRALHFPLLGFETGLERETAWNNWDIFYEDLLQVTFDIRTGNTKDGWKKHGINRQPFFELEHRVTRLNCRWPRFPKNLRIKKILFDIIMGSARRRHCYGPRLFLLGGAHD